MRFLSALVVFCTIFSSLSLFAVPSIEGYDPDVNRNEIDSVPYVSPPARDLPRLWDWRWHNAVSPIKDQASPVYCGSCWAHGTTAVIESIIKINTGRDVDLSEQQLVSCSPSYGTCQGGNFAFGFYTTKGGAYEADFPYKAANVACKAGLPVQEKIKNYYKIGSKGRGPTVEEMKTAIFTYGPIAVTVSASGAWNFYKGGVYSGCNSNPINHLVALVGYDDDQKVWILKNSHGTAWGEQGYMRIPYLGPNGTKCNNVGFEAMYAVY